MLVCIMPLRAPETSNDWSVVSKNCRRAIQSCLFQLVPRCHVILICNEPPNALVLHDRLTVIAEDFPLPNPYDWQEQIVDKQRKIKRGLIAARTFAPCFWMKVDADDCLSNRLAGFVSAHPNSNGWIFNKGYIYTEGARAAYLERRTFFKFCGTSSILRADSADYFPANMAEGREGYWYMMYSHSDIDKASVAHAVALDRLPFPGALYCVGNGQNLSSFGGVTDFRSRLWSLKRAFNSRPATRRLLNRFGYVPEC